MAKKFIFENCFDIEAVEEVPECDLEPLEPPRLYTEEQYQTAILQAKEDAVKTAKEEMTTAIETQTNELVTTFCAEVNSLTDACQKSYSDHFQYNTNLSIAIVTKLFPVLFKDHNPDEVLAIISDNMQSLKTANEIKIHLASNVGDDLKNAISEQFKAQNKSDALTFVSEDQYAADQISIQWDDSGIERNSETILETIINTYRSKK